MMGGYPRKFLGRAVNRQTGQVRLYEQSPFYCYHMTWTVKVGSHQTTRGGTVVVVPATIPMRKNDDGTGATRFKPVLQKTKTMQAGRGSTPLW